MARKTIIKLKCGIDAERWVYSRYEYLQISLVGLYHGYPAGNKVIDTDKLSVSAKLFKELSDEGFENNGIDIVTGYYESIDDLLLTIRRPYKKTKTTN